MHRINYAKTPVVSQTHIFWYKYKIENYVFIW